MVDRFPEAFERYEEKVDIKEEGIKTFPQLITSFGEWATDKWKGSRKQVRGLAIEAKKRDIEPYVKEAGFRHKETGRFEKKATKETIKYDRYRNPITGRFMKKPEWEE